MSDIYLVHEHYCESIQEIYSYDWIVFNNKESLLAWMKEKKISPDEIVNSLSEFNDPSSKLFAECKRTFTIFKNPQLAEIKATVIEVVKKWIIE